MTKTLFRITAGTDVGCVRTNNEDNFILNADLSKSDWFLPEDASAEIPLGEDGCVFVVADGMGGLNAGEVASAITVETVKQQFLNADLKKIRGSQRSIEKFMTQVVLSADAAIKKRVKEDSETAGMGTTIIFVWVIGKDAHLMWCGDSRAYVYNPNKGLERFSKDHSYVQELVDSGKLDPELAFDHPQSNIITRCLGDFKDKARPEYKVRTLVEGDMILLCSDGLCGLCQDEEIVGVLADNQENIDLCKNQLINHALTAGGYDNVTVALFQVVKLEETEEPKTEEQITDPARKPGHKSLIVILVIVVLLFLALLAFRYFMPESWNTIINKLLNR